MRSLPWLVTKDGGEDPPENPRKRKRNPKLDADFPQSTEVESVQVSDSDNTILDVSADNAMDAMIPGYDNDDAYIMVEQDFLEAAKQVTRHLHLEAYQKQTTAPITGDIVRPTIEVDKKKPDIISDEEDDGIGVDDSTLGKLLTQKSANTLVAATPIKRKEKPPIRGPERKMERQKVEKPNNFSHTDSSVEIISSREHTADLETLRKHAGDADADDEDEDDEDLDRPRKAIKASSGRLCTLSKSSSLPSRTSASKPTLNSDASTKPSKAELSIQPDWIFSALWSDDKRPLRPVKKRDKVSLATQLEESSLKLLGKKKAISLKDQFRFMES